MSKRNEIMPTQELSAQLKDAFTEIGDGDFRIMSDFTRHEISRPVMYEPVFFDENNELVSQKILYSNSAISKARSAQNYIENVQRAFDAIDPNNPVKNEILDQKGFNEEKPYFLEELLTHVDRQQNNTARVIGGLLILKDYQTSLVGLRTVYNRALMDISTSWEIRDVLIKYDVENKYAKLVKNRDIDMLSGIAVRMAIHCLYYSKKLKPNIIFAPNIGIKNL